MLQRADVIARSGRLPPIPVSMLHRGALELSANMKPVITAQNPLGFEAVDFRSVP